MRRSPRSFFVLTIAVLTSAVLTVSHSSTPAEALTSKIWLNRAPIGQRLAGAAVSADGQIGFVASSHSFFQDPPMEKARVWRSTNYGAQWTELTTFPLGTWDAVAVSNNGQRVVALGTVAQSASKSVMISMDQGDTWIDKPLAQSVSINDIDISPDGNFIALATSGGIYLSNYSNSSWTDWTNRHSTFIFPSETEPSSLNLSRLVIGKEANNSAFVIHAIHSGSHLYTESHDGQQGVTQSSWLPSSGSLLSDIAASDNGDVVIASSSASPSAIIHVSNDSGSTWTSQSTTGQTNSFVSVAVSGDGSRCVVAGYNNPLLESTCSTTSTWNAITGFPVSSWSTQPWLALALSTTGSHFLAGTEKSASQAVFVQMNTPAPVITNLDYRGILSAEIILAPETGGGTLWIIGNYFYDVTSITIGGTAVSNYTHENDTMISVELPARSPGPTDVVVTTAHGTNTLAGVLQYYPLAPPTVTSTSQSTGSFLGRTPVTFTGDGLGEVTEVRIGGRLATITEQSRNELIIRTPANRIGLMNITMSNSLGNLVMTDAWTSTWESRSLEPEWATFDGTNRSPIEYAGNETGVSAIIPDDDNGFYVFGNFEELNGERGTDYAAHWTGTSWEPVGEDGNGFSVFDLGGSPSTSLFGGQGILTAVRDNAGGIWVGGEFEVNGQPANIARINPGYGEWWVPSTVPDGRVTSITPVGVDVIVGGDFGPLGGVPTSSRLARLSPGDDGVWSFSDDGVWSGLGSDGSGASAIKNDGLLTGSINKTVQSVVSTQNGSLLVGGSFRLASTTTGQDILVEFNGTTWRSVLQSTEKEVVTSLTRGSINGVETVVVSVCKQPNDSNSFESGRVISIVGETVTTVGSFNGCVRDVAIVGDAIVAAGWFDSLMEADVETTTLRNLALFHNSNWQNLNARVNLDNVIVYNDYHLAVSTYQNDSRIGRITGGEYIARYGPLNELIGRDIPLAVSNVSSVRVGDTINVTVTGTSFSAETEATINGRPVDNLIVTAPSTLTFTAPWSNTDRQITIYGRTETVSATLTPPQLPSGNTSVNTTTLPSNDTIRTLPTAKLFKTKTPLSPKSSLTVKVGGFVGGEEVWFIVASTPRQIGSATAGADGTVRSKVKLPSNLVGKHTFVVWSPQTRRGVRQSITIFMTVKSKKTKTITSILKSHGISVPKKSVTAVSVRTKQTCALRSPTVLQGRAKGKCHITMRITPPKGKAITRNISLVIT